MPNSSTACWPAGTSASVGVGTGSTLPDSPNRAVAGRTHVYQLAWRYRDYVIGAFNADKPFDRFVREQIAGDLLPWKTVAERRGNLTATGFLMLGPTNYELQDKELLRMEVVDEQLDTLGRAFMGMTVGCARCHDHKFDPIRP